MTELQRRKIIAVVDDDSSFLGATENMLNAHGFETEGFASAQEFLERGVAAPFDCLLIDIHLGGMSGIELRRRLKVAGSPVPVIFMTAVDSQMVRGVGADGRLRRLIAEAVCGASAA